MSGGRRKGRIILLALVLALCAVTTLSLLAGYVLLVRPRGLPTETPRASAPTLIPSPTLAPIPTPTVQEESDERLEDRLDMVESQIRGRGVENVAVLDAMETVPRHEFVPENARGMAYADHPLPIGHGQTISQPYIVALMTELLELEGTDRVLEIGTGSAYQAAILAEIVDEVYTVEIIEPLAIQAKERLGRLGYSNAYTLHADGYYGWEEHAPYDAIIVTAAPDHIPLPLTQQLKDGAKLVIPVGPPGGYQTLWQATRQGDEIKLENVLGVRFVPLTGEH